MSLAIPRKTIDKFSKIEDPDEFRRTAFDMIEVDRVDVFLNRILCIVYIGHERTRGGIIIPTESKAEDIWQGKCALVLKVGPTAFQDGDGWNFAGSRVDRGDWVTFKIGNSSQIEIQHVPCRIVTDNFIETRIADPRMITS
jgi:co-chaperonin GroES (HSP10)